jgi:hypothetical protein
MFSGLSNRLSLLILILLSLTSAVLLADMAPNSETAERLLNANLEELKKTDLTALSGVKKREYFAINGEKTTHPEQAAYTLEYEISPPMQIINNPAGKDSSPLREINLMVEWVPNPNVKQTQKIRLKSYLPAENPKR